LVSQVTLPEHLGTYSDDGDEWQQEQCPLSTPTLLSLNQTPFFRRSHRFRMTLFESIGKLEPPLDSGFVHLEESDTHDHDDDTGDYRENTFPDLFSLGP
jgi:hypothetical protein